MNKSQTGIVYIGVLLVVATLSFLGMRSAQSLEFLTQRENEAELIAIGREFQSAIASYYYASPGAVKQLPRQVDDLLTDNRFIGLERHLRKVKIDPFLGQPNWSYIRNAQGGIEGVASTSKKVPIRLIGFTREEPGFGQAKTYQDWRFVFVPNAAAGANRQPAKATKS